MVTQNWEGAQWLTCHYDVFGQTMCLKTMSKWMFFCVNAASGTWREDTCILYCCQWHKTAIKALLSTIFIVWTVTCISVTHTECIVTSPLNVYANVTQRYILCTLPILQYYTSIFVYICQAFSPVQDLLTYSMEQSPSWEANWFCS